MAQKILLVNEFYNRERFELTAAEARQLLNMGAAFFCLADTLLLEDSGPSPVGEPFIAIHAGLGEEATRYEMFVSAISESRAEDLGLKRVEAEDLNPFTGRIVKVVAPPRGGPEQN